MATTQVPVDLLHWVLAILPIVALLVFLVPLRWRAPEAGPMAMFTAGIVALLAFRTPWNTLAVASAKGVWDAIFILYVIWPALLLYQITKQAGAYDALRQGSPGSVGTIFSSFWRWLGCLRRFSRALRALVHPSQSSCRC